MENHPLGEVQLALTLVAAVGTIIRLGILETPEMHLCVFQRTSKFMS